MLLRRSLFAAVTLSLFAASAQAQPTWNYYYAADYKAPAADMQKWAERLKQLCPSSDWTVKAENNDILIGRLKTVSLATDKSQPSADKRPNLPRLSFYYRMRLRFSPLISAGKYEELAAENIATTETDLELLTKYKMPKKPTEIRGASLSPDFEQRKQDYIEASKKLVLHRLPHLYSSDYSITIYQPWWYRTVRLNDPSLEAESKQLEAKITDCFGHYDHSATSQLPFYTETPSVRWR